MVLSLYALTMSLIRNIFGILIAAIVIAFAVSNRQDTTLIYSPVHEPLEVPLYLITLLFLAIGFMFGGFVVWLNSAPTRRVKRQQRKHIVELEKELQSAKSKPANNDAPAQELFPAFPSKTK